MCLLCRKSCWNVRRFLVRHPPSPCLLFVGEMWGWVGQEAGAFLYEGVGGVGRGVVTTLFGGSQTCRLHECHSLCRTTSGGLSLKPFHRIKLTSIFIRRYELLLRLKVEIYVCAAPTELFLKFLNISFVRNKASEFHTSLNSCVCIIDVYGWIFIRLWTGPSYESNVNKFSVQTVTVGCNFNRLNIMFNIFLHLFNFTFLNVLKK